MVATRSKSFVRLLQFISKFCPMIKKRELFKTILFQSNLKLLITVIKLFYILWIENMIYYHCKIENRLRKIFRSTTNEKLKCNHTRLISMYVHIRKLYVWFSAAIMRDWKWIEREYVVWSEIESSFDDLILSSGFMIYLVII